MPTTHLQPIGRRMAFLVVTFAMLGSVASAQTQTRDVTYVSRGKNPKGDHGTFVLKEALGRADYRLNGQPFVTAQLHHYLDRESNTDNSIWYAIYREDGQNRLWSFQTIGARPGEFVVYVNESGEWWMPDKWKFYDLCHKYPESPPVAVYEAAIVATAIPVYYSASVGTGCCWASGCCWGMGCCWAKGWCRWH